MAREINYTTKRGPTFNGKKLLLTLDTKQKGVVLRRIKKRWEQLIKLHFKLEGSITVAGTVREWKEIGDKTYKPSGTGILEYSTPTLQDRYLDSITYDSRKFSIRIGYPKLIQGQWNGVSVDAGVHQDGAGRQTGDLPKRPFFRRAFTVAARDILIDYFKEQYGN